MFFSFRENVALSLLNLLLQHVICRLIIIYYVLQGVRRIQEGAREWLICVLLAWHCCFVVVMLVLVC